MWHSAGARPDGCGGSSQSSHELVALGWVRDWRESWRQRPIRVVWWWEAGGDRGFRGAVCFLVLWGVRDAALGGGARRRQLDDGRKAGDLMRNRELLFGKQPQNLAQRSTPPARRCRLPACRWPVRLTCRSQSPAPSSSGAGGLAAGGRCRTNREHWGTCWGPSVGGQGRKPQQLQLELQGAQCKTVSQEIQGHKEVRASLFLPM